MAQEETLQKLTDLAEADPDYVVLSREGAEAEGTTPDAWVSSDPDTAVVSSSCHHVEAYVLPKEGNHVILSATGSDLEDVLEKFGRQARFIAASTEAELRANAEANGGQIRFPEG